MALSCYYFQALAISALLAVLLCMYIKFWRLRNPLYLYPMDWPVVGMVPSLVARLHNIHDELTAVLAASGCNFKAQGPLASGMRFFVTADPTNVRHIFTSNHTNYPKGKEFADIFDISILGNPRLLALMASNCRDKVANGFLPFLIRMASTRAPFDMQDLITRLVFDLTAMPIFGVDPGRLSKSMPSMHVATAMDTIMEVGLFRHTMPASFWKVMRRLNIGPERKLAVAHTVLHGFVKEMTEKRKDRRCADPSEVAGMDIISVLPVYSNELQLSKILINYMIAGRDTVGTTLPWVFYNLAKNPRVVSCIRKELALVASSKAIAGAPIAVRAGETILISIYAMGRIEALWGKDCHEYRPERWLSEDGTKLRYVPSHKFMAFNSGPRMCLVKDIAITQMKTIVAAVVWNFDMEVVEGQSIEPKLSCLLQLKNGLMMMIKQRGM
ncbi:hypothetical protein HU200_033647 [Digitaria exilis]|uniref:Cytochrome P450 n=1 Tax=Digitaria exilis TaxID=1010633 RepID=A0A835EMS9_9POAL|nr:hypothetical protein HU200_033647 [Digitaria exilis]